MNVLIVDDSAAMRMMVIKTLRQAGLNSHTFAQAAGASFMVAKPFTVEAFQQALAPILK